MSAKFVATVARFIPIAALRKRDEGVQGYYVAACGLSKQWRSAGVFRSLDDGQTWSHIAVLREQSVMGKVVAVTNGDCESGESLTVTVRVLHDGLQLEGYSPETIEAGANRALIGQEVVSFENAELVAPCTYELSGFVRGRRGTNASPIAVGNSFTLLKPTALARVDILDERRSSGLYLVLSQGQKLTEEPPQTFGQLTGLIEAELEGIN